MLDFIPTHLAADTPLLIDHPELFMQASPEAVAHAGPRIELDPKNSDFNGGNSPVFRNPVTGKAFYYAAIFREGLRDPQGIQARRYQYGDSVAFDLTKPETRKYLEETVLKLADLTNGGGLRFDQVHHLVRHEIKKVWFPDMSDAVFDKLYMPEAFVRDLIVKLREKYPDIILYGEYLSPDKDRAVDLGFDFVSDLSTRSYLLRHDMLALKSFLEERAGRQNFHFYKYLEGHDEYDRIVKLLGVKSALAASVLLYALPGSPMLLAGQEKGFSLWLPRASIIKGPQETENPQVAALFQQLGELYSKEVFQKGSFKMLEAEDGYANSNLIIFEREYNNGRNIVAVNYSDKPVRFSLKSKDSVLEIELEPFGAEIIEIKEDSVRTILRLGNKSMVVRKEPRFGKTQEYASLKTRDNPSALGGIDLTPANMNVQIQSSNGDIKFRMDPAMLQQLQNAAGFVPVIINIQPLINLRQFLGITNLA